MPAAPSARPALTEESKRAAERHGAAVERLLTDAGAKLTVLQRDVEKLPQPTDERDAVYAELARLRDRHEAAVEACKGLRSGGGSNEEWRALEAEASDVERELRFFLLT